MYTLLYHKDCKKPLPHNPEIKKRIERLYNIYKLSLMMPDTNMYIRINDQPDDKMCHFLMKNGEIESTM